jgi:hypothetical protein
MSVQRDSARLWLVDGFNLLHACFLPERKRSHWWSAAMQQRVCVRLEALASRYPVWVVFDGARPNAPLTTSGALVVAHAPSADEFILETVSTHSSLRPVTVVTGDRSLRDRCTHRGAECLGPRALAEWLTSMGCTWPHTRPRSRQ